MIAPSAAPLLVLLAVSARAFDPKLAVPADPEPGVFSAATLSLGSGRSVCGRLTFDQKKGAQGASIYFTDAGGPGDDDAIRLSPAVLTRRAGFSSRAAILARRHGTAAVALGAGVLDAAAPSLSLIEPILGAPSKVGKVAVRLKVAEHERVLREGDAVCVEPAEGRVIVPSPDEAEARVAASEAARAYDGLRDAESLARWVEGSGDATRAAALMRELAPRVLDGGLSTADAARVEAGARKAAGTAGLAALKREEARAWTRAVEAARRDSDDCAPAAGDATSVEVLDRLVAEAKARATRAADGAKVFGGPEGGLAEALRSCQAVAVKRRKSLPATSPSLEAAAVAAGATRPEATDLPADAWRRFVAENVLGDFLSQTGDDASLGLRRKAERIRQRLAAARISEGGELGRAIIAASAACPCLVVGDDATVKAADSRAALAAVRDVWVASWGAGPLGARLRAGRGADIAGSVRLVKATKADASGLLFSRDPATGLRRVLVEAAAGGIEGLLEGGVAADRYALDGRTGRVITATPASADGKRRLSAERLAKLARLARALDAWRGGAVEAAFSFDGDKLFVHHARPLEPPRPPTPLADPFSPRPSAASLPVKSVR